MQNQPGASQQPAQSWALQTPGSQPAPQDETLVPPIWSPIPPMPRPSAVQPSQPVEKMAPVNVSSFEAGDGIAWLKAVPVVLSLLLTSLGWWTIRQFMHPHEVTVAAVDPAKFGNSGTRVLVVKNCEYLVAKAQQIEERLKTPGTDPARLVVSEMTEFDALNEFRLMHTQYVPEQDRAVVESGNALAKHVKAYMESFRGTQPDLEGREIRAAEAGLAALLVLAAEPRAPDAPGTPAFP